MMNHSPRPRTLSQLSEAVNHRLTLYALAASSAGLGLLSSAQPAEAKIIYTKTHQAIGLHHPYKLDLNHDGIMDFLIQETQSGSMGFKINKLATKEPKGNAVEGYPNYSRRYAAALKKGMPIGGRQRFVSQGRFGQEMAMVQQSDTVFYKYYGPWINTTNGYLGLKFKIQGKTHYGWARLSVIHQGFKLTAILTGFAYETIPNKTIIAGNIKGKNEAEVQPATLGHLARGASAIPAWRMKLVSATTH